MRSKWVLPASLVLSLALLSCGAQGSSEETAAVLKRHLDAVKAGDIDGIMADYAADAVFYTPDGPLRGQAAIRGFFEELKLPAEFWESFKMIRQDTEGEIAYMVWSGGVSPLGTDTFVIRGGKIVVQTFAVHMPPPAE